MDAVIESFFYTMSATMIADFVKRSKFYYIRHANKDSDCGRSAERLHVSSVISK